MISKSALTEFKEIVQKDYSVLLDDKTALQLASDFLTALEALLSNKRLRKRAARRKNDN
jgi:hypothetical protein